MKMPSVTIITPTCNRRQVLARAIDSVRSQSVTDYEHIIVDDGSSDGTGKMIAGYGDEPFRLRHALAPLEVNPLIPLMLSSFVVNRQQGPNVAANTAAIIGGNGFERALAWLVVHIAGASITARRDAVIQVGGFNPQLRRMQDLDFLLRMATTGPVVLSDRVDWIKRNSPDAITLGANVGAVEAFGDLVEHNNCYQSRYPELIPYIVALLIIRELKKLRLGIAGRAFNENLRSPSLGFSASQLFRSYSSATENFAAIKQELDLTTSDSSFTAGSASVTALVGKDQEN